MTGIDEQCVGSAVLTHPTVVLNASAILVRSTLLNGVVYCRAAQGSAGGGGGGA